MKLLRNLAELKFYTALHKALKTVLFLAIPIYLAGFI